jgi:hypothetical protein
VVRSGPPLTPHRCDSLISSLCHLVVNIHLTFLADLDLTKYSLLHNYVHNLQNVQRSVAEASQVQVGSALYSKGTVPHYR